MYSTMTVMKVKFQSVHITTNVMFGLYMVSFHKAGNLLFSCVLLAVNVSMEHLCRWINTVNSSGSTSWVWDTLMHHDDVIKWKHFPRYWPFYEGNTPVTKVGDPELWCFLWYALEQTVEQTIDTLWIESPSLSLWRHCSDATLSLGLCLK